MLPWANVFPNDDPVIRLEVHFGFHATVLTQYSCFLPPALRTFCVLAVRRRIELGHQLDACIDAPPELRAAMDARPGVVEFSGPDCCELDDFTFDTSDWFAETPQWSELLAPFFIDDEWLTTFEHFKTNWNGPAAELRIVFDDHNERRA